LGLGFLHDVGDVCLDFGVVATGSSFSTVMVDEVAFSLGYFLVADAAGDCFH